ncbi:hypothetical protein ScPMuIL_000357 [Solemya velum]
MEIQWTLLVLTACVCAYGQVRVSNRGSNPNEGLPSNQGNNLVKFLKNNIAPPTIPVVQNQILNKPKNEFPSDDHQKLGQDERVKQTNRILKDTQKTSHLYDTQDKNKNVGKVYQVVEMEGQDNTVVNAGSVDKNVETNRASKVNVQFMEAIPARNENKVGQVDGMNNEVPHPPENNQEKTAETMRGDAPVISDKGIIGGLANQPLVQSEIYRADNNIPRNAQLEELEKSKDELKVLWDWNDFSVNFEQYVLPEQKVRRAPHSTVGEPWPMPQYYIAKKKVLYRLDKVNFSFSVVQESCDVIEQAVERYKRIILEDSVQDPYDNLQNAQGSSYREPAPKYEDTPYARAPHLTGISVKIRRPCTKYPSETSDESYDLFVKQKGAFIYANEVWGALRGLETFSQLVFKGSNDELYIKDTVINDYPRFIHRGLLIDTSRHYIFKEVIFDVMDGMLQNKMNVFHWHIVDDQSFPYQSRVYPDLSEKGAFHPAFVYSLEDIAEIIEYARIRGIRVIPEFDTPGHTYSWGLSRPDILTQCYQGGRPVNGYLGPMDPSKNETFRFLKNLFNEVFHVFKDKFVHLGGDEVPMTCWSSNPEVLRLLARLEGRPENQYEKSNSDMYSFDIRKVLEYYENRFTSDLKELAKKRNNGASFIMWQEIMNNHIQLPKDTVIQIWQGDMSDVQRAISLGHRALYSTCWYLDLIEYGTKWPKYYTCDPADSSMGYQIDESKVLGGEACLWAEYIDNENLMTTLWPRASAAAERLWSSKNVKDLDKAAERLQEHRCRMLSRGLAVGQISGPDYCLRRGLHHHTRNNGTKNCTSEFCSLQRDLVEIERINVHVERSERNIADCSNISGVGNVVLTVTVTLLIIGVIVGIKKTGGKIIQIRIYILESPHITQMAWRLLSLTLEDLFKLFLKISRERACTYVKKKKKLYIHVYICMYEEFQKPCPDVNAMQ